MKQENTTAVSAPAVDSYSIHPALARALTAAGYDLAKIVSNVKAQKGRSVIKDHVAKAGEVKLKEATKSADAESSFTVMERKKYVNDDSAPMRFAAFSDSLAAHWKKHGEPSGEITADIVPAHLVVWLATSKTDEQAAKDKAAGNGKPSKNGRHTTPAEPANV